MNVYELRDLKLLLMKKKVVKNALYWKGLKVQNSVTCWKLATKRSFPKKTKGT